MAKKQHIKNSFYTKKADNIGINLCNGGYEKCTGGYCWGPGVKDFYIIHVIRSGRGVFKTQKNISDLSAGDAFLIRPGELVTYTADKDDPWEYYWIGFTGADVLRLLSYTDIFYSDTMRFTPDMLNILTKTIDEIVRANGQSAEAEIRIIGKLYLLFSYIVSQSSGESIPKKNQSSYFDQAIKFIQNNYSSDIGIPDIAQYVGISRSHLYRVFMEKTGMSPNEYLCGFRINQACFLMRSTSLNIKEISRSVGYFDSLYFSRSFKKSKGMAPTQYIALERSDEKK